MLAILKIINLHFWKSFFGPFFAFVFPLIFVALLGSLLGYDQLFGGSMAIASMSIALTAMPQAIFEFKRSALLKRIGVTPIKPWMFLAVSAVFYFVVMIVSSFWTLVIGIAIFAGNMNIGREIQQIPGAIAGVLTEAKVPYLFSASLGNTLANVNWAGFLWGLIMNIAVGISLGFVLVSTSKSTLAIQGLGIPILIISQFLAAQVLPLPMISKVPAMQAISYLSPFKYSTGLMIESFSGNIDINSLPPVFATENVYLSINSSSNIFDINTPFQMIKYKGTELTTMFGQADKIVNLVMPFVFTGIFSGIAVKTFKWSAR